MATMAWRTGVAARGSSPPARRLAGRFLELLLALLLAVLAFLTGCATGPQNAASAGSRPAAAPPNSPAPRVALAADRVPDRDGPEASPTADLASVPDAEPVLEPIRSGGPNKPYEALGQAYVPMTFDQPFAERGLASWYGRKFHGRRTASGEVYNMYAMTAAHPTLPIPSYARVRNPTNGREVVVRINDRGPFHAGRVLDLSYTAALKLDLLRGVGSVELQRITFDDIRSGAWRREADREGVRVAMRDGAAASVPVVAAATPSASIKAVKAAPDEPAAPELPTAVPAAATQVVMAAPQAVIDAPGARAFTSPARGFWVQLGAFRLRDGAEIFQQRVVAELDWLSPLLAVFSEASMFRLQAGPYPSREQARGAAERVRAGLQLVPVIVERR